MKIKVCGVKDSQNLQSILGLKPDFVGLNFYRESKRFFTHDHLPDYDYGKTKLVGVFVNSPSAEVAAHAARYKLAAVQLHGTETLEYVHELRKILPKCEIIKAFGLQEESDLKDLPAWKGEVDYLLFDKKAISFGGTGQKFNWDLLDMRPRDCPFFLAGGIGPEDCRSLKAMNRVIPDLYAVDINSRFEDNRGLKDLELVRTFVEELRR